MKPAKIALLLAALALPMAPAMAQAPATQAQQQAAGTFVGDLAGKAFAILQDQSLDRGAARAQFRELLRANFDVDGTGMRLIRSYRAPNSPVKLTDAQLQAYRAALPDFLVNTYSERLYDFATAKLTVVRTLPVGNRGDVNVFTRITDPNGGRPIEAVWQVKAGAKPLVTNILVNGVNIALTQEADFKSYIERNGFDALVNFMNQAK